jgi:hypothetical protein
MQNLQNRKSSLSSKQEVQTWDLVNAWRDGDDMSKAENQNISEHMNNVYQYRLAHSDTNSDRTDKSTGTTTSIGLGAVVGTNASNTESVGQDHSAISSEDYQKSLSAVQAFSKTHEFRDSSGKTRSASNSLNNTINEVEQVGRDISSTAQTMESIQKEISNAESYGTTINQNLNDEVLNKVQKDHEFPSKQEAAQYLNTNPKEAYKIAKELNENHHGNSIQDGVNSKGRNLNKNVNNQIGKEDFNYEKDKVKMNDEFKEENSH